jgi:hypothetical protein
MCVSGQTLLCASMYLCVYVRVYVCMYACRYENVSLCINTYICILTCMHAKLPCNANSYTHEEIDVPFTRVDLPAAQSPLQRRKNIGGRKTKSVRFVAWTVRILKTCHLSVYERAREFDHNLHEDVRGNVIIMYLIM